MEYIVWSHSWQGFAHARDESGDGGDWFEAAGGRSIGGVSKQSM
jgi:hypothetical protein